MTSRVINDPGALGWVFDPATGRWEWGGSSGGGAGGVEEAPQDGNQYARIDASWEKLSAATVDEDEPADPVTGQLWYKPSEGAMYVYDGSGWKSFGSGGDGSGGDGGTPDLGFDTRVLIVAGGGAGGGGMYHGAGGGAGGVRDEVVKLRKDVRYAISVGGGGTCAADNVSGGSGEASGIERVEGDHDFILTTVGGGGGGNYEDGVTNIINGYKTGNGHDGGSGGGAARDSVGSGRPGSPIDSNGQLADGYGNLGGENGNSGAFGAGGGGGALTAGGNGSDTSAGNGGQGIESDIDGVGLMVGGGGGGGAYQKAGALGGSGIGGNGGIQGDGGSGYDGVENTGSGGGGAQSHLNGAKGGKGGSGKVVIRSKHMAAETTGSPDVNQVDGDFIYIFKGLGTIKF